MNNKAFIGGIVGTLTSATGTALQTSEVLQIISLVITILGGLLTLGMGIWTWWNKAKADGKITPEEIEEGTKIIQNGIDSINNAVDNTKGDKDNGSKQD